MLERIRWNLRRYRLTIGLEALVLEVGAVSSPYPRANVVVARSASLVNLVSKSSIFLVVFWLRKMTQA